MKKLLSIFVLIIIVANTYAATTYYWVGGASASYATAANWNTTIGGGGAVRTTPATDDILIFDGNNVGSGVSATTVTVSVTAVQTIGALTVQNNNLTVSFTNPGTIITLTLGGTSNVLNIAAGCTFDVGVNNLYITNAASFTQTNSATPGSITAGSPTVSLGAANTSIQAGQIVSCYGYLGYETVTNVVDATLTLSSANNVLNSSFNALTLTFYPTTFCSGTGTLKTRSSSPTPLTDCYWPFTVEYCATGAQTVQRGMYTNLTFSGDRSGASFSLSSGTINIANTLSTSGLTNYVWTATAGTVNFVGTTNQSVPSFTYFSLYNSVYKDNTLSAAGDITVNGSLALTANTIFSDAGYTITVPGNVTGSGTHYSPNPSGAGKISMTGSGNSFSALTSMGNFEINGGTSVATAIGQSSTNLQAGCTFTVTPTAYLNAGVKAVTAAGAGCTFAINGWVSVASSQGILGNFPTTNSPTITLGSASTIVYSGTSTQFISAINYANLSITGTRTTTSVEFPAGVVGISGVLDFTGLTFTSGRVAVHSSSTINFNNPTGGQTIPALGNNYYHLTMGNTSGTQSLGAAITVDINLTMTAGGKLSLGAYDLTLAAANGVIVNYDATSYIVTNGAGKLTKLFSAAINPSKIFPIGDATSYAPVTLAFTGTITGSVQVSTTTGDHAQVAASGLDAAKSVNRSWTIANPVALTGLTSYSPTFTFVAGDVDGGATTANFIVRKNTASVWSLLTAGSRTAITTQATGVTTFGDFIVGEEGTTPVVTVSVGTYTYNGSPQGPNSATNTGTGSSYTYSYVGTGGTTYAASATMPTLAGTYTAMATVAAHGIYSQASSSPTAFTISPSVPNAPTSPLVTVGDTKALITVTAPADNGGSAVLDYTATAAPGSLTGTGSVGGILVTGLTNGTPYTFTVTARNAVGSSVVSAATAIVTPTVDLPVTTSQNISSVLSTASSNLTVNPGVTLTIDQNTSINSVTISAGAKLDLSTHTLTSANVVLKASKTASPVVSVTTPMVISGSLTFKKTLDHSIWYFISFPSTVTVADIGKHADLGAVNTNWWIKRYRGDTRASNGTATTNWQNVGDATLTANEGYIIGLADALTGDVDGNYELSFTLDKTLLTTVENQKDLTVGTYVSAISATNSGWNLVGMPYLRQFNGNGLGINYITKFNGSSYDQYAYDDAALDNMNPFEAFFVQASSTTLTFAEGSRHLVKSLVANNQSDRVQLNFTNTTGTDKTTLIIDENQTTAYQVNQDLEKWVTTGTAQPQVYTLLNGTKFAYNALPVESVKDLPLVVYSQTAGAATIGAVVSETPSRFTQLLLTDNVTGATTDLLAGDYHYTATAETNSSRFRISAQQLSSGITTSVLTPKSAVGEPVVSTKDGKLKLTNLTEKSTITLLNPLGQIIASETTTSNCIEMPISGGGLYVVKVESDGGSWSKKIVVKE